MMNESEFARKIAHELDLGAQSIEASTAARLKQARERAIAAAAQPVPAAHLRPVLAGWQHLVEWSHEGPLFWLPVLLLLSLLAAAVGSTWTGSDPIEPDALLLASDLPPEAYANKEFVAWLEKSS